MESGFLFAVLKKKNKRSNGEDIEEGCALDLKFQNLISYVSSCERCSPFFVKREMLILFSVNCEATFIFSVKRDLGRRCLNIACISHI